jgi:hypothetical protein
MELQFVGGPASYALLMSDILVRINGHNIVDYFIKHSDSGSHTSLFESLPEIQVAYHVGYAACVMVSPTRFKASCSPLYSFQFIFVLFWYVVTIP